MVIVMNAKIVFAVLSVLLLLVACAPKAMPKAAPAPKAPAAMPPAMEPATSDAAVSNIETTNSQVDQLDKEFDTSGFDSLDKDLASIDNLDFG